MKPKLGDLRLVVSYGKSDYCDWVVDEYQKYEGGYYWEHIAEFWGKKDAQLFIKAKKTLNTKEN